VQSEHPAVTVVRAATQFWRRVIAGSPAKASIETVKIPPQAPRANAYAERWVRTVRAECLDWTLVWNRQHLQRLLARYVEHYNTARPHRGLDLDVPVPVPIATVTTLSAAERVERVEVLGGLIHEYHRAA
jgi:transposase InsO family protein